MRVQFTMFCLLIIFTTTICENEMTFSSNNSRSVSSLNNLLKIDNTESLSDGIKELIKEEQRLQNKDFWTKKKGAFKIGSDYFPENKPKFPLPYYLIPVEDVNFLFSESLDNRVAGQLMMKISGKKHYKLFIHPEAEVYYDSLRSSYNYIGPEQTEFLATPTTSSRELLVWSKNNPDSISFIAKVSLDKNSEQLVSENEIERSVANQKLFDHMGNKNLELMNLKIFPETAGLVVTKINLESIKKYGGQLIQEIPDEVIKGEKRWFSFSILMNLNHKQKPLILDVIKQSGLSSYDFFKTIMIESFLQMYEQVALRNGVHFEPLVQNLILETTNKLKPTGKWIIRDFSKVKPDIFAIAKNKGPVEVFMDGHSAAKYNLQSARSSSIGDYIHSYKHQIFDMMLAEVAIYDSTLTPVQIQSLKNIIDSKFTILLNNNLALTLKSNPTINDLKNIEEQINLMTEFDEKTSKKKIKSSDNLKTFIENKKFNEEWIEMAVARGRSDFYLTDIGLYEVSNKKVIGLALFNRDELEEYNVNNKMLTNFTMPSVEAADKTSAMGMVAEFFVKKKVNTEIKIHSVKP